MHCRSQLFTLHDLDRMMGSENVLINSSIDLQWPTVLVVLAAILVFSWVTVSKGWLALSGAIAASALGACVVICAGFFWLAPLFFFFGSSTLLGKLLQHKPTSRSDVKQGKPRDAMQVLCNGLVYGLCAALIPLGHEQAGYTGMLISMAVAISDTWSSEIGIAVKGSTWDILRFKRVAPGLSGGISWAGTLGGVAGGIGLFSAVWSAQFIKGHDTILEVGLTFTTAVGVIGMLLDSVLGSAFQARYRTSEGSLADQGEELVRGWRWMTNDVVNLLSNAATTVAALGFL